MTVVAISIETLTEFETGRVSEYVALVADSRISRFNQTTTEIAPKILHVNMRVANRDEALQPLCFAFSGSVTGAFLTHATAEHFLMNLFSATKVPPPTPLEVAQVYADIAKLHMTELGSRLLPENAESALFEGIICGWSFQDNAVRAYHIRPVIDQTFDVSLDEIDLSAGVFRIGSGSVSFDEISKRFGSGDKKPDMVSIIMEMIDKKTVGSVGGYLQSAFVDETGFHPRSLIEGASSKQLAQVKFLGIDLDTVRRPQNYKVGNYATVLNGPTAEELKAQNYEIKTTF